MTANPLTSDELGHLFLDGALNSFRQNKGLAEKAIVQLPDDKLRTPLDANTNSIAVIMKHVGGNLRSRWTNFLTADGEKPDRNRDSEFVDTFSSRQEIIDCWDQGWQCAFNALAALSTADLGKTVYVRGAAHTVPLAIERSLAHSAYHVGQIVLIARLLAGDQWNTITIPRGGSEAFTKANWGK